MNAQSHQSNPVPESPPDVGRQQIQSDAENKALPSALERHTRKCQICRHPDREDIEQDYKDWHKAATIARHYKVDDSALHRHLVAVGLVATRGRSLRIALDRIIERGAECPISGNTIIRAVRAHACLTDDNQWIEPTRTVIHIRENAPPPAESQNGAREASDAH
jgi:hypothetical protein